MSDEIKRISGTLHRATQSACNHWVSVVPAALEALEAGNEKLISGSAEDPPAEPDIPIA